MPDNILNFPAVQKAIDDDLQGITSEESGHILGLLRDYEVSAEAVEALLVPQHPHLQSALDNYWALKDQGDDVAMYLLDNKLLIGPRQ